MNTIVQPVELALTSARAHSLPSPHLLIIAVLWAAIYVPGLFHPALLDDADSVHAEAAREILLRDDWVTLHANGIRYLEKAPLMYWSIAASFKIFGIHEWSARLPLALAVLALLLETWSLGRRVYGERAGLYAAVVLATALGPYIFTRFLIPDLIVGLWLTFTLDFFLRTLSEDPPTRWSCWGMAIASALNVLTKGLIGLVFPAATIILYLLLTRNLRHLPRLRLVSSALVFLAVAAPWHILAGLRNPAQGNVRGFFWFYFVNEHFLRYLNKRVPRDYDTVPLLLFWVLMLAWLFPWSAFLPQAIARVPHRWRELRTLARHQKASLLFALWAIVILVFFSFSTRQEYYVVPALPALALLIGSWLGKESEDRARSGRASAGVLAGVGATVFAAVIFVVISAQAPPSAVELADLLSKNPQEYALSLGHVLDLTPQALGWFRPLLLTLGIAMLAGFGASYFLRRKGRLFAANLSLAVTMVAVLWVVHRGLIAFEPVLSSKDLAAAIERQYRPGEIIVIDGDYEDGSTLNFYTGRPVRILNHREANLWYGSFFPDAPRVFETNDSFRDLWRGDQRVYLWSQVREPDVLKGLAAHQVAKRGGKYILSNEAVSSFKSQVSSK